MVFKCQTDSYLKEFTSVVKTCESSQMKVKKNEEPLQGFDVVLEDTIIFPEGGGQPSDSGTIDGKPVISVRRVGDKAIHFVSSPTPLTTGASVSVTIDWDKRFDHMQQHSGQHLITAIAEQTFSMPTTSWYLGEEVSYIEMDAITIPEDTIKKLEQIVNHKIRASVPVSVNLFERDDKQLEDVRSRMDLPEDQSGPLRVITIEGIDRNLCCGTHVSNLSHLQVIKLLFAEKGKKNKTNLYFVAGNRVLSYLDKCVKRDKLINTSLKCTSEEFPKMIEKLQKSLKISQKNCLNAMRDLAKLEAKKFLDCEPKPKFLSIHRKESDIDFITIFVNEVKPHINDTLLVLSVTDDSTNPNSSGQLVLAGNSELIEKFMPRVCELMGAKGVLKDGKFSAKVSNLAKRAKLDELIKSDLAIN